MAQEQPVGEVKFTLVVLGRIALFVGLLLAVVYLVPFVSAYSKKTSSKKIMDYSIAEKNKLEVPLATDNRRLIIMTETRPAGSRERARLKAELGELTAEYDRLDRAGNAAEQVLTKSQQVMDSKMFPAGLGGALVCLGLVLIIFSKISDQ